MYTKDGKISSCKAIELNGRGISNPSEEQILEAGWIPYVPPMEESHKPTYEERVVALIREKYSMDDEFALLRQRDTKPSEFEEYNSFCEECKIKAKSETNE